MRGLERLARLVNEGLWSVRPETIVRNREVRSSANLIHALNIKMHDPDIPAHFGDVTFMSEKDTGGSSRTPAKYACVSESTCASTVRQLMLDCWKMKTPSAILSVSGSAQVCPRPRTLPRTADRARPRPALRLMHGLFTSAQDHDASLERVATLFKRGLSDAAQSTDAWIVTGGTDTGCMALAGESIQLCTTHAIPCVGCGPATDAYPSSRRLLMSDLSMISSS